MCELVPRVRKIELYADCIDKEELIEELMKEFIPSPPKSSVVIEEIEDKNAQLVAITPAKKKKGKVVVAASSDWQGNVQQFSRADAIETSRLIEELSRGTENVNVHQTLKATTVEGLQQPAHDGLEKSSEFDDSSNEDYVVDQFIDDEYSMDDYVVEDEVQVDHEVGNETNTECELSATTSKKRGKRRRQEEDQNCISEEFKVEISKYKAYDTMKITREVMNGSNDNQYAKVWNYADKLKRTHGDSTIEIVDEPFKENGGQPRFMRMYVCLRPLK
ncbi:hypothetical protein M9H77_31471 [Catharanthus roseus]|uniref:Uncharacterized protein n=1 Tax=Catharanthus roseus TaxID=4058 RepID=A0ACC0A287_CATRO|nr:hypothetical protein M9H77_31471 [Catharanthus roseus]